MTLRTQQHQVIVGDTGQVVFIVVDSTGIDQDL